MSRGKHDVCNKLVLEPNDLNLALVRNILDSASEIQMARRGDSEIAMISLHSGAHGYSPPETCRNTACHSIVTLVV